ncbi:MAG: hypothetical protein AAFZ09_11530, partial [Pseudomonadota bacterium]
MATALGRRMGVALALALLPAAAQAAVLDFRLTFDGTGTTIPGTRNVPLVTIENLGDGQIESFELTIGDTAFNFDGVYQLSDPAGGTSTIEVGDDLIFGNTSPVFDSIRLGFTGFDRGEQVSFGLDIDDDSGAVQQDFARVLFDNGDIDNAVATVVFGGFRSGKRVPVALTLGDGSDIGGLASFRSQVE